MKELIDYRSNNSIAIQLVSSPTTYFERAYLSAKTKFQSLSDEELTGKDDSRLKKRVDIYKIALKDEMLKDLSKIATQNSKISKSILDSAHLDQFIDDTLSKEINEVYGAITR